MAAVHRYGLRLTTPPNIYCINVETGNIYAFEPDNPDHYIRYVPSPLKLSLPFKFAD